MPFPLPLSALIPVTWFALSSAISFVALNVAQSRRVYCAPFLLFSAGLSFRHLNDISSWLGLDGLWGLFITVYVMHITAVLFIEKRVLQPIDGDSDNNNCVGNDKADHSSVAWRLIAAYKVWSNPRWLPPSLNGSNERVDERKLTLPHSREEGHHLSNKSKPSSTTIISFTYIRAVKLIAYSLIYRFLTTHIFPGHFRPMTIEDFSPQRERYLSRLTLSHASSAATASSSGMSARGIDLRETVLRAVLAIDWIIAAYLVLDGCHHLSALLFVSLLRLDPPEAWPPFFGSIWHITSIRRFWGRFWHRLVVGPYGSHTKVVSRTLFGFEARSKPDKFLVAFCIFLFSGLAHSAVSWQMGQRCGVWRDAFWFVANFATGVVEAVGCKLGGNFAESLGLGARYRAFVLGVGGRLVGGLWVFAFFFWSVPKWQYPKVYCATLMEIYEK